MTRRLLTLIFTALMLAMCPAVAQNLKFDIVKFELNQLDGTASNKNYEKIDGSGNKYAIIKVRSTDGDEGLGEFMFNFNSLKSIVVDKGDELWVYVQKNAKIVTISREGYTPLLNFDLKATLQAGKTYNMEITYDRVEKVVKKEPRKQMLSFKVSPAVEGAVVMYKEQGTDNELLFGQTNKQGTVSKNLNFGIYEYKILANNYFATEGIVKLNNAKEVYTENITLKGNFATITLTTKEGAEIYVDNEFKGHSSWTGPLQAGEYTVECKQEGHRPTSQTITVEANADKTIELQRPTPITGFVSVVSSPLGAIVLIDGKESGKTPCNISDVLVGNRKVTLTLTGYAQATKDVVVKEGEVADVNITLSKGTALKPVNPKLEKIFQKGEKAYDNNNLAEAIEWYKKAAEQGHAGAQCNLGLCYFSGEGVEKNLTEAIKWFKKAAEQGYAEAQYYLGFCYENGWGVEKNFSEAVKWYTKAAEQGYAEAQCNLGICYENGIGVEKNYTEAVKWYKKAAKQGDAGAQCFLGFCYENGDGVEKNFTEAVKWFKKAAEQGYAEAQHLLGICYENGIGVAMDFDKAAKWYKKAAEQGHAEAQNDLGYCYADGDGVEKNYTEAVKWYRKAAEQGNAGAQNNLGICYHLGQGVEEDLTEAVKWYTKAAEQGYAKAQYNLGFCYYNGEGVTKDTDEAVKWFKKAAEQGYASAQFNLGICYENGWGVEKNFSEAVKWLKKAAEQGFKDAQKALERLQK